MLFYTAQKVCYIANLQKNLAIEGSQSFTMSFVHVKKKHYKLARNKLPMALLS